MDYSDEGMKNFADHISNQLSNSHEVLHFNAKANIFSPKFWKKSREFSPDIIHIFLRITLSSLIMAIAIRFFIKDAKIAISAIQPPKNPDIVSLMMKIFTPNLIFCQSEETESFFSSLGISVCFLPSGVDLEKFHPVNDKIKKELRMKYGLSPDKFILLHIGHINEGRNLEVLKFLKTLNHQREVLIIGSTNEFNFEIKIFNDLVQSGCIVFRTYFENIEELYQLSDCYLFPTVNANYAVEIPLSIMEAMACNIPVISTLFGGLPRIFPRNQGIIYVNSSMEFADRIEVLENLQFIPNVRDLVQEYSWKKVADIVERKYLELLKPKG